MIKTFKFKKVEVLIKSNMLNGGKIYFGDKNVEEEIENAYNEAAYLYDPSYKELFTIEMIKHLNNAGIKVYQIKLGDIINDGTKVTDITSQQKIEPEK